MGDAGRLLIVCDAVTRGTSYGRLFDRAEFDHAVISGFATTTDLDLDKFEVIIFATQSLGTDELRIVSQIANEAPWIQMVVVAGRNQLTASLPRDLCDQVFAVVPEEHAEIFLVKSVRNAVAHSRLVRDHRQLQLEIQGGSDRLWEEVSNGVVRNGNARHAEMLTQAIIDAMPDATVVITRDYRIAMANRTARELAGFDPCANGVRCFELFHKQDRPCHSRDEPCALKRVTRTKQPQVLIHRHVDQRGQSMIVEVRAIPFFDDKGEVVQMCETCRDITEQTRLREKASASERALEQHLAACDVLIGTSSAMQRVRHQIAQVAPTPMTVLIQGESGTGKNVVARLIHEWSGRGASGSYVVVNCPAIPDTLLESELFGYEKGAFTGATTQKRGRLELADRGTLVLDEIGLLPIDLQSKLLHTFEHKQFTRVGGHKTLTIDARVIAATNAPLASMIAQGRFRSDLYYRLNQFPIMMPPLRERKNDIPLLVEHFLQKATEPVQAKKPVVPRAMMTALVDYAWPGNVRELKAVVERFVLTREVPMLDLAAIDDARPSESAVPPASLRSTRENAEIQAIRAALQQAKWNQRVAARILGVGYGALRYKIARYGIERE